MLSTSSKELHRSRKARRVSRFTSGGGIAASWTCLWSIRKSSGVLRSRLRQLLNSLRKAMAKSSVVCFACGNRDANLGGTCPETKHMPGMGWHAFRRFRKTWLRGKRCQEDINIFWMGHKPKTMSEIYSHRFEEIDMRLAEAEAVGFGFDLPKNPSEKAVVAPIAPR